MNYIFLKMGIGDWAQSPFNQIFLFFYIHLNILIFYYLMIIKLSHDKKYKQFFLFSTRTFTLAWPFSI